MNYLDATLTALADPTRRQVVELLRERPRRAGELAAVLEISGPRRDLKRYGWLNILSWFSEWAF